MSVDSISVEESTQHREAMQQLAFHYFSQESQPVSQKKQLGSEDQIAEQLGGIEPVSYEQLPAAYRTLLNHDGHMTVTLEAWHDSPVEVQVVDEVSTEEFYSRHSLLARKSDGRIVQSGIMKIKLAGLPAEAQHAIENGSEPLGRILIRSKVLREVELLALWQIKAGSKLSEELKVAKEEIVYGRTARILVDGNPAVELLEIVTP